MVRDDAELMAEAGKGDRRAFGELVERHHRTVLRFVHRFMGRLDRDTAEDLTQDVFLKAWQSAESFRPRAQVLTWLLRIARNTCLNARRRRRLRQTFSLSAADLSESPLAEPSPAYGPERDSSAAHAPYPPPAGNEDTAADDAEALTAALAKLPDRQRAAIILRHMQDLSYADIAEVLGVSIGSVESLLFRARNALRRYLTETENSPRRPQVSSRSGVEHPGSQGIP